MSDPAHAQPAAPAMEPTDGAPPHRYTAAKAADIESRWQTWWAEHNTFTTGNPGDPGFDASRPKFYCLDMFPYPSGAGLHVGHPEGYTATDIISRFKRMRGFNVLHPMGWDAFGLPAEQYAIATNVHPAKTTRSAIDTFRRQLQRFGFSYDWSREIATIDPPYYRWTQWIWLQLYHAWYDTIEDRARPTTELIAMLERGDARVGPKNTIARPGDAAFAGARPWSRVSPDDQHALLDDHRLAYISEQVVNWCPKLGTVLANEEVIDGKSERGGFPVVRRPLRQWMFRITAFADRLLRDLEPLDWPTSTKTMQREWIGKSEGAYIDFDSGKRRIRVFTTRPDTVFGATYLVLAPEHPLVDELATEAYGATAPEQWRAAGFPGAEAFRAQGASPREMISAYRAWVASRTDVDRQADAKTKSGVFIGAYAVNPLTNTRIPIFIADYVLMGYGTGAIMAVPGQDQRDWDFATQFNLPIVRTVTPTEGFDGEAFLGDGPACNSGFLDGMGVDDAKRAMCDWLEANGRGQKRTIFKLRDWLFSRQRYWGEPFPVVFDEDGSHYPIAESALPVMLPDLADFKPIESEDPTPLLGKATDWVHTTAGAGGVDPHDLPPDAPVRRETNTMPNWAGSCWYYLRFLDNKNDQRLIDPAIERYWMGENGVDLYIGGSEHAVLHLLYARFWHKALFDLGHVSQTEPFRKLFHQGLITSHAYQRADKSLLPTDAVDEKPDGTFVERATGALVVQIVAKMSKSLKNVVNPDEVIAQFGADTFRLYEMYMGPLDASKPWNTRDTVGLHRFLQRVWRLLVNEDTGETTLKPEPSPDVERQLHRTIAKCADDIERLQFNTAIASMFELLNTAQKAGGLTLDQADRFVRCLAPFAPHIGEELWSKLGHPAPVSLAPWPTHDPAMLVDSEVEVPVQIGGKIRARILVAADADAATLEKAALADEKVIEFLAGKSVRKVIAVPGKMVNIVAT